MFNVDKVAQELRDNNRDLQDLLIGIGDLLIALQQESKFPEAYDQWKNIKRSIQERRDADDED